ncbi:MAG TPA: lysophospholipid acyltransferase family protein [Pseudolabrys sp.]|jgi:lysophospholipid acyltransferase (LPLAT)-like uncharacterized protein|nr:lysophospholipid acyltransferase family protein [Pseudolabrys sp.]
MPMSLLRSLTASPAFQEVVGAAGAWYLRLVWNTSRLILEPADIYDTVQMPVILAFWHGQHLMAPFVRRGPHHRAKALISRHRDGEINARAVQHLGVGVIRGSGAHNGEFYRKGGAVAFTEMLEALKEGYNIAITADVPKVPRVAGLGIVKLAQHSGRPIQPVAITTSHRIELNNWDRSAVNLPFSRISMVGGSSISVAPDADDKALEAARGQVESELNRVTVRAAELADKTGGAQP